MATAVISFIDMDSHLADEDPQLWTPYLPQNQQHLAPQVVEDNLGVKRLLIAERLIPKPRGNGIGGPLGIGVSRPCPSVADRLQHMDECNVTEAYLTPGFVGMAAMTSPHRDSRLALVAAHNRLVVELATESPRLSPVLAVSIADPEWSIAEIDRYRRTTGIRAVVTRPTTYEKRPFRDCRDHKLLKYLRESGIVIYLHTTTGYHQQSPVSDWFDDYVFSHAFSHPIEQMVALADLLASGQIRQGLRVVVVESGCGWVPWFVGRLQAHFDHTGGCEPIHESVEEQIHVGVMFAVEPGDPDLPLFVREMGSRNVAFMTDFPHWDTASAEATEKVRRAFDSEAFERYASENARSWLGLPAPA